MLAGILHDALTRAGVPVVSVSIGNDADRGTWVITYAPSATAEQRATGENLRQTYDPATDANLADVRAALQIDQAVALKAGMIATLWQATGAQPNAATIQALRTKFIQTFKAL